MSDPSPLFVLETTATLLGFFSSSVTLTNHYTVQTLGRATVGIGGAVFYYEATDTTTADNGGTIRVDGAGRRWYAAERNSSVQSADLWGVVGDGATDDRAAMAAGLLWCKNQGGGELRCRAGQTIRVNYTDTAVSLVVWENVDLNLAGATLTQYASGPDNYGIRPMTFSRIRNGTINTISSGTPSASFCFHTAITVGSGYQDGGTPASPNPHQFVHHWILDNLTLATTRENCPVIQVLGGPCFGNIRNIIIPDSNTNGGVHLDWGNVGVLEKDASLIATVTYPAWLAGNAYQTFPHDITVENVQAGDLTYPASGSDLGTRLVRLSACYNITVLNCSIGTTTYAAINVVGGDLGAEFPQFPWQRDVFCRGIGFVNCRSVGAAGLQSVLASTFADNIYVAARDYGYAPMNDPFALGDVLFDRCVLASSINTPYGFHTIGAVGVFYRNCKVTGHQYGHYFDNASIDVDIVAGDYSYNTGEGIEVRNDMGDFAPARTDRIRISSVRSIGNGSGAMALRGGTNIVVENSKIGSPIENTQVYGIREMDGCVAPTLIGNRVYGLKALGAAFYCANEPYVFRDNYVDPAHVSNCYVSLPQVPAMRIQYGAAGISAPVYWSLRSDTPGSAFHEVGTTYNYLDPLSGGFKGEVTTTGGTPGIQKTWAPVS